MASDQSKPPEETQNSSLGTLQAPLEAGTTRDIIIITPDTGQEIVPPVVAKQPQNGMPTLEARAGESVISENSSVSVQTEVRMPQTADLATNSTPTCVTSEVAVSTNQSQQLKEIQEQEPTPILVPGTVASVVIESPDIMQTKSKSFIPAKELIMESEDEVPLPAPTESTEPTPVQSDIKSMESIQTSVTNVSEVKPENTIPDPIQLQDSSVKPEILIPDPIQFQDSSVKPEILIPDPIQFQDSSVKPEILIPDPIQFQDSSVKPEILIPDPIQLHDSSVKPEILIPDPIQFQDSSVKPEILIPDPIQFQDSSVEPEYQVLSADSEPAQHAPTPQPVQSVCSAIQSLPDPSGMVITPQPVQYVCSAIQSLPDPSGMVITPQPVPQPMEISTPHDMTSESVSTADCSTRSVELMHTEGNGQTDVAPTHQQQQQADPVVMDTELPAQNQATDNQSLILVFTDSSVVDLAMSPMSGGDTVSIDPALIPLPQVLEALDSPEQPSPIQIVAIDTIVIADSPSVSSYEDPMEVIDLTSDCSSDPHTPSNVQCATTPPSKRSKVSLSSYGDLEELRPVSVLSQDLQLLELLINNCEMLGGLCIEDQKISFSYLHKGVSISSTLICIEEDYPQLTLTITSEQKEKSDILSKRLPCVAWDVLKECCEKQAVSPPPLDSLPPQLIELLKTAVPFHSQISTQSTASQTSNCTDGEYDEIEPSDDDYNEFDEVDEEVSMHALMERDIERVRQKHGQCSLETRNYGSIGDIDIDLVIDMNFLEPEIARAWGVKHTIPLVVRLSLNSEHYLDGSDIKVEVFQEDRGNAKGICKQVEKIISQFISNSMKASKNPLCNSKVEEAVEAYNTLEQRLAEKRRIIQKSGGASSERKGMLAQFMGKFSREKQVNCDMLIAQLVDMGWETELAVHALQQCNMDLEKALDYLSEEKIINITPESEEENPKTLETQKSRGAEVSGLDWMSDIQDTNEAALKSKTCPPLSHGFLCQVIQYLLNRIPTLNDFCVICDETHLFSNGAMLKPTVCARELCSFAFQTLGVMADVADSIATGPEVVELLVAMCNAASLSGRRTDILDPYPTVVDPNNPRQFSLHPKEKDFKKVEKAMSFVLQELKALPAVLKERLDSLDTTSFPLLQWILASNRCHIVKLTPDRQIKSMGTTHQFLLLSAPPAKEAAFRKLKQKFKSIYAFHGSSLENWHSIMRNGLMNASGTKFQLHGAAYGAGIYLSPHASVSFGYSGIHGGHPSQTDKKKGRPTMLSSQNLNCIALCEVIDSKIKKSGNIWVASESDHVVTRFFFVYEDNTTGDTNFDTREDRYIKEIENAVRSLIQS